MRWAMARKGRCGHKRLLKIIENRQANQGGIVFVRLDRAAIPHEQEALGRIYHNYIRL